VVGRRRRRLYWTAGILGGALLLGGISTLAFYRSGRASTYRPGEDHAEITRQLDLDLPSDAPRLRLTEVTDAAGLGGFRSFAGTRSSQLPEDMGPGAAWGDFDGDGDDDLFLVSAGGPLAADAAALAPSQLYENRGDGAFALVPGFPETRVHGMGAAWGDADGDSDLDLVVTGFDTLRLFRNRGGRFERDLEFPELSGFWAGASWCDYDHDGDLDLYVCGYVRYVAPTGAVRTGMQYGFAVPYTLNPASFEPERNLLFRNRGDGTFDEVARELGVDNLQGRSLSGLWHDLDDDGWPELYVANDISDNVLYHNRGGRFEEISHAAWVADYRGAMGLAAGDWNRDGDDDIHVTHWIAQENALYDNLWRDQAGKALRFMDVADQRGVGQIALPMVGWGTEFFDLDRDGWLDLAVANGSTMETEETPKQLRPQASFLFWNRAGQAFHDLAPLDPALSTPRVSRGLALADYDADGDLDLLIVDRDGGARLLRNDTPGGNWIELRLRRKRGTIETALVALTIPGAILRRSPDSVSYLSQSSRTVHFGLGSATQAEAIEVRWPGGGRDTWRDVAANAIWELTEGEPAPRAAGGGRAELAEFWRTQRAAMDAMKKSRDPHAAIDLFRRALEIDPGHEDSLYYLANCLADTGDVDTALATLDELKRRNPMSHRAFLRWGTLRAVSASSAADLDAAVLALERAVEINPEETGALQSLGEVALLRGEPDLARQRFEWIVRTNAQPAQALYLLGYLAWRDGDAPRAQSFLERSRAARGKDWKPKGASAEGETKNRMHEERTPLGGACDAWDGSPDPASAYRALAERLTESRRG